jgi:hypothetical protein
MTESPGKDVTAGICSGRVCNVCHLFCTCCTVPLTQRDLCVSIGGSGIMFGGENGVFGDAFIVCHVHVVQLIVM